MQTVSDVIDAMSKFGLPVPQELQTQTFDASVVMALHGAIPALRSKLGLNGTSSALDLALYDKTIRSQAQ